MDVSTATDTTGAPSTRERILDIALELFTEHGYDKTSLRDIAERLGTTKAALYYHFKSKAEILLELHLRLHAIGTGVLDELERLDSGPDRVAAWPAFLDRFIDEIDANRELVAMHQRNQSALEELHNNERHIAANDDMEARFTRLLSAPDIPPALRVRIACSLGAVIGGLISSSIVGDIDHEQRTAMVRQVVHEMFPAPDSH